MNRRRQHLVELAQRAETFAARRMAEAQRELERANDSGDAARSVAAALQLSYARSDLRRAIRAAAKAMERAVRS